MYNNNNNNKLYPCEKISRWLPCVTKPCSRRQFLGNGMRLWYFLVRVCGRLENPLQHKHSLLHYVANEKKGILYANDFECARFAGENMFCHANVLLANENTIHRNSVEKYNLWACYKTRNGNGKCEGK